MNRPHVVVMATMLLWAATSSAADLSMKKNGILKRSGTLLVLPPRDCIQDGKAHPKAAGTGLRLQKSMEVSLAAKTVFTVKSVPQTPALGFEAPISAEDALAFGREQHADYVLTATLGEFRNAAAMTFRTDFVTLDALALYDVETGNAIWSLTAPVKLEKGNVGDVFDLLDELGSGVGESLGKLQPRGECPASHRPEWASANAKAKKQMNDECRAQ